jgi:3-oxoacyl-(acyl-carrier-protein) synthase
MIHSTLSSLLRDHPICVTGMGCFSAAGDSVTALWEAVEAGRGLAAWREFTGGGSKQVAVCGAPALDDADPRLRPVRRMDRCVQMAWVAASQAVQQAQLSGAYDAKRVGVSVGTSRGSLGKISDSLTRLEQRRMAPSLVAGSTLASLSGVLSQGLGFRGPGGTLSATCASAAMAIGYAAEQILMGKVDAMVVGGTDASLHPVVVAQMRSIGLLGHHEEPGLTCRPFDVTRNGLVLGEGSAFLALESARAATDRGAPIWARLAGWATGVDDSGRAGVREDGAGLLRVMQEATEVAGLDAGRIDYINAHGTGTVMNDRGEAEAVRQFLGERATKVPCSSTKPVTGHCLGATPALEAVICIGTLKRHSLPPTAACREQDPQCGINVLPLKSRPGQATVVMSNSLGFWGYHASLILAAPGSNDITTR